MLDVAPNLPDLHVLDVGAVMPRAVRVADINGDGRAEVVFITGDTLRIIGSELQPLVSWQRPGGAWSSVNDILVADVTGDGIKEVVVASGPGDADSRVEVFTVRLPVAARRKGIVVPSFPRKAAPQRFFHADDKSWKERDEK